MIENISLISHKGSALERSLHRLDAPVVLLEAELSYSTLVKHLGVLIIDSEGMIEIINRQLVLFHIEVALRSVLEEFDVVLLCLNSFVKLFNSLVKVVQGVITAAQAIPNGRIIV